VVKPRKIRTEFRKNRTGRTRRIDWTRHFKTDAIEDQNLPQEERIGKDEQSRKRTVMVGDSDGDAGGELTLGTSLDMGGRDNRPGRVLSVHGLISQVCDEHGEIYQCATRRLLKTLTTDQRHVVAAGDRVRFRPVNPGSASREGIIVRVEPRYATLCRTVRNRQHVIVANIDQMVIVTSAAEPRLKPNLIDRLLVTAEKGQVEPLLCINKLDLVDPASLQPLVGVYSQMGYRVLLLSAETGLGIDRLRRALDRRSSVVTGQSGVGKSSLLNAVDPSLVLKVREVSEENQKGRHTTTTAVLLPLVSGGYVVDTPGMRQFQLWDVISAEVAGFYRDLRPYVNLCRFTDCTHTHEAHCAVKDAVAGGRLDQRRYESYCHLFAGEMEGG
jgi:ribosome biogenesis GTPase